MNIDERDPPSDVKLQAVALETVVKEAAGNDQLNEAVTMIINHRLREPEQDNPEEKNFAI